jgi:predicted Zn finger-like uncharacterized protein
MIVTCTSCQARFRIPDEKIGPKGAKVRCSKCRNVFVAKPAAGAGGTKAPPRDPFAAPPAEVPSDPFAAVRFAQLDPFAAADPFAASPAGPSGSDPFAAPPPPSGSRTGAYHLPVTDLSDLAAGLAAAPSPGGLTALAPPLPATPAPPAAGGPPESAGSVTSADDLVLEEPSRAIPMGPPAPPSAAPGFDFGAGGELAEPGPAEQPSPVPVFEFAAPGTDLGEAAEPMPGLEPGALAGPVPGGADFAGADPFAAAGSGEPFGLEGAGRELGGPRVPTVTEPIPPERAPPPASGRPIIAARRKAGPAPDVGPLSAPASRGRLQGFVANAVSLAALLAVAAGLLSWWLRDAAGPDRPAGGREPVAAVEVSSGLYETAAGTPVLFVRGEVRSRSAAPLGRVAVRAEVLRGSEVLARAEGLAGAVPTPEEVAQIGSPEDAARLRARVASRAPERLEAGGSLPFLVTFDSVPDGLGDAVFRVVAEPQPGDPARTP